jgi:tRNA 2-thiouridine synthesizing protein E
MTTHTSTTTHTATASTDIALDQDGHLCDHTIWTPDIAQQLADTLDVSLTRALAARFVSAHSLG